ncbi:MAG: AlkZ family DNA glycosylase [Alphaproteobacteria bacterium]|nr:AlkZ family DNA glycosylase [Alphaproteobacteria bacterium]
MSTRLTARQLNRATLARQLLLARARLGVVDAVERIVAIQAQEPVSPYLALWTRLDPFEPADLDRAFARHDLVKASLLRITLHAVTAADYPAFHEAMQRTLRGARLNDRRFTAEGVAVADVEALVPDLLEFAAEPRRNPDVERWLEDRFGAAKPRVWWALRHYGPFVHAATGGPWSFGPRPAYVGSPVRERPGDVDASLRRLVVRYLQAFGPASVADIAQFSTILRPPISSAIESLGDALVRFEGPAGERLFDVPGGDLPGDDAEAPPRFLPMWDSTLLAYADRSRMLPPAYRKLVMRTNGDALATVLVDGLVAGVWRPVDGGIEVTAFERLADETWSALETEARSLATLLAAREPAIHGRYAHWWDALPAVEVRVLGRT